MSNAEIGKRGRKLGTKIGPRKVYFVCAAVENGDIVEEEICFDRPEDATAENAANTFKEKFLVEPSVVRGPYHMVKSLQKDELNPKDNEFVSLPLDQIQYNGKRYRGEFRGWSVIGQGLVGREDVVCIIVGEPVDEDRKRRPSVGNQAVLVSAIKNFRPFETATTA